MVPPMNSLHLMDFISWRKEVTISFLRKKQQQHITLHARSGYHLAKHCHVSRVSPPVRDLFDHFLSRRAVRQKYCEVSSLLM